MNNTELLAQLVNTREHLVNLKHLKIDKSHDLMLQALMRKVSKAATSELMLQQIADIRAARNGH